MISLRWLILNDEKNCVIDFRLEWPLFQYAIWRLLIMKPVVSKSRSSEAVRLIFIFRNVGKTIMKDPRPTGLWSITDVLSYIKFVRYWVFPIKYAPSLLCLVLFVFVFVFFCLIGCFVVDVDDVVVVVFCCCRCLCYGFIVDANTSNSV